MVWAIIWQYIIQRKATNTLLHGRNERKTYSIHEKINGNGEKAKYIVADLNDEEDFKKLLCSKAKQENIKILITNGETSLPQDCPFKRFFIQKNSNQ